jgi:hypothetical protein
MSNQNVEDMYSKDEKVLALSMYKHSGKGYKFLRKLFALPSRQTISKLLNAIPINTGVNNVLFKYLKESSLKMAKKDKYCVLLFDEMCLSPSSPVNRDIKMAPPCKRYRKVYTWQVSSIRHIITIAEFATLGGCRSPRHTGEEGWKITFLRLFHCPCEIRLSKLL